jgi:hypothetical protein
MLNLITMKMSSKGGSARIGIVYKQALISIKEGVVFWALQRLFRPTSHRKKTRNELEIWSKFYQISSIAKSL